MVASGMSKQRAAVNLASISRPFSIRALGRQQSRAEGRYLDGPLTAWETVFQEETSQVWAATAERPLVHRSRSGSICGGA